MCHEQSITRNHSAYFSAHVLVTDDGPDHYRQIMADSLGGIIRFIESVLHVGVSA
jgi:hypothetical protein